MTKVWDDAENQDGIRPERISVTLLADGEAIDTAILSEENRWTATVKELPIEQDGRAIVYTWTEETVTGYTLTVSTEGRRTTLTNTHVPKMTEVTVKKVWDDQNNARGTRPRRIIMTLSDGQQAELNEENGWTATLTDLPVYNAGKPVTYTWTEQQVIGYRQVSAVTEGQVTTFTNRLIEVPEVPPDHKVPRVPREPLVPFEDYETALGVEVLINHVGDCFD